MYKFAEESVEYLGKEIKKYRNEAGLSQSQLSAISGIDRAQLSRVESGELIGVTYVTVDKILHSLNKKIVIDFCDENVIEARPFVKWAGGKTQILNAIEAHLPKKFNNYFEPFVGGGAVLFKINPKNAYINDMNSELICAYKCFQCNDSLVKLIDELKKHEANNSEEYYYNVRKMDNDSSFKSLPMEVRAGRMIYLNKACFNGLYRVNSKGYFNVPFCKKEKIKCFDEDNFNNLFSFFKNNNITITNVDFEEAVKNAKKGDFVYFDPPYDTLEGKDNFTSYNKDDFGKSEQERLANVFKKLSDKGVFVMLSNHNTEFIKNLYRDFTINIIPAKRMINSNAKGRGNVEEVLITNYE